MSNSKQDSCSFKNLDLVIGNTTIDAVLGDDVDVEILGHSVTLKTAGNKNLFIPVQCGPIAPGGNYTAKVDFYNELQNFPRTEQFGGGGYLSAVMLSKISDDKVCYLDISTPSLDMSVPVTSLANKLESMGIESYFLNCMPIPLNIVLGKRSDKIVIKSRLIKTVFGKYHPALVNELINDSRGILLNSVKDESLVELVLNSDKKEKTLVAVITKSLEPDYALRRVVPNCICQFNYDEFGYIINPEHDVIGDEETRIESAIEGIKRIRADYNKKDSMYVTLGKNGVLCSDSNYVYHVRLKDEFLEKIDEAVNKNTASTCGAGDAHAAGVLNEELKRLYVLEIAKKACAVAVSYLGFKDILDDNSFIIKRF